MTNPSIKSRWTGRIVSGLAILFLLFDAAMKLLAIAPVVEANARLGYPAGMPLVLGLIELGCLILYLLPRTAVLGAVLWTGYLGGAVATHLRVGSPLFAQALFPVYVAALLWLGLWLRDPRLRPLLSDGRS